MTDKYKIRAELKEKLEELDCTSSLRLTLIRAIEYIDSTQKELVSEDLEKAAEEYTKDNMLNPLRNLCKDTFKTGARWQKKQFEQLIFKILAI